MKTIREYLEMLNEPERSEAIENANKDELDNFTSYSLPSILLGLFVFEYSKQGLSYWINIHSQLLNNTYKFENENNN